jgi:benzoylformate decarboxylase
MDAIEDYPDLKYVLVVQEGVAVGLAEGYARASGKVAFVSLHIDTGLANAFSLLSDSKRSGTPMVVTAGNRDIRKLAEGRDDLVEMAKPYTKWAVEISHAEQYPSIMRRAFTEARTPPTGPVFVAFAGNSYDDTAPVDVVPSRRHFVEPSADPQAIEKASESLCRARSPVMVVGDRVSQYGAMDAAVGLAERLGARVYGTGFGGLNFPTAHPLWCGPLSLRQPAAREALRAADVVLAVGTPVFQDFFHQPGRVLRPETKLVHLDIVAGEIGKSEPTDIGILASPKSGLTALDDAVSQAVDASHASLARSRSQVIGAETKQAIDAFEKAAIAGAAKRPMAPATLAYELGRNWPAGAVLFDDAISTRGLLQQGVRFSRAGDYYGSVGGAIGWGIGASMGVKLGAPERPVVAVIGDGSAMMTLQGLWTAMDSAIPVVFVICNNGAYRVLKVNMAVYKRMQGIEKQSKHIGMDFKAPFDMAALAKAFGMASVRIEDPARIGPELKRAVASGKPALLDVVIDGAL